MLQVPNGSTESVGVSVLKSRGIFPEARWYWIGVGAIIGYTFLFNFLVTLALTYLNRKRLFHLNMYVIMCFSFILRVLYLKKITLYDAAFGRPQAILSEETLAERNASKRGDPLELSFRRKSTSGKLACKMLL